MAVRTDIYLGDDWDLAFEGGDFAAGVADNQHVALIFKSQQGEWKQHPSLGIGINDYLEDDEQSDLQHVINERLKMDGYFFKKFIYDNEGNVQSIDYGKK